jgi:hypothetical protein
MFLGKLWVRIKGEFLAAREEISEGLDSRKTGERLQKKIQTILKGETSESPDVPERAEETYQSSSGRREIHDLVDENYRSKSIKEMERTLDLLKKTQDQLEEVAPNPNPRKLG